MIDKKEKADRFMFWFSWAAALISLIGSIFNVEHSVVGFYFWSVANIAWIIVNIYHRIWAQAFLFFAFLCVVMKGILTW